MKTPAYFIFLFLLFIACKKETNPGINGTVISQSGASLDFYLVEIDNPGNLSFPFFCDNTAPMPPIGQYNCRNSICITNLPASLKVAGAKIVFSKYKNLGPNLIWSSIYVPRDVEVYDARLN